MIDIDVVKGVTSCNKCESDDQYTAEYYDKEGDKKDIQNSTQFIDAAGRYRIFIPTTGGIAQNSSIGGARCHRLHSEVGIMKDVITASHTQKTLSQLTTTTRTKEEWQESIPDVFLSLEL